MLPYIKLSCPLITKHQILLWLCFWSLWLICSYWFSPILDFDTFIKCISSILGAHCRAERWIFVTFLISSSHTARPSESKWSPSGGSASNSSLAHELWKVPLPPKALSVAAPTRPPPGLTSQKLSSASSGWDSSALRLGGWGSSESRYTPGKNRKHKHLNTLLLEMCSGFC